MFCDLEVSALMFFNGNAIDDQNRKLARERSRWKTWKNSRQCTNFYLCIRLLWPLWYCESLWPLWHYCKSIELSNVHLFTLLYYSTLEPNVLFVTVITQIEATVPSRNFLWKLWSASSSQIWPKRWQKRERSPRSHKYVIYLYITNMTSSI